MTFETVRQNIKNGVYQPAYQKPPEKLSDQHTIDAEKSIKWNLEQVKIHNERRSKIIMQNRQNQNDAEGQFLADLTTAIHNEYDVNMKQDDRLARRAYDDADKDYQESIANADSLADFYIDLRELED